MRRTIVVVGAAALAAASTFASAAAIPGFGSASLGAGNAVVARCDGDGFSVSYTTSRGVLTAATVGGIADPDCEGADLRLVVKDAAGALLVSGGPVAVPVDADAADNSAVVALGSGLASQVAGYELAVVGP